MHDNESAVRAAGLRALGMLATLSALKEETGFLMDLADVVCLTASDNNLGVRIKGAWALANLCNCLSTEKLVTSILNLFHIHILILLTPFFAVIYIVNAFPFRDNEEVEPVPLEVLLPKIYHVSIKACKDNDKVKCNAVRALGSILYLCPDKHILKDTSQGLEALINCATLGNDMKVSEDTMKYFNQ